METEGATSEPFGFPLIIAVAGILSTGFIGGFVALRFSGLMMSASPGGTAENILYVVAPMLNSFFFTGLLLVVTIWGEHMPTPTSK